MTIDGALNDLNNLLKADDIPIYYKPSIKAVMETITIEIKPMPKMGKWIKNAEEWQNVDPPYICSECGRASLRQENFCCSCGADMRGDTDEDSD